MYDMGQTSESVEGFGWLARMTGWLADDLERSRPDAIAGSGRHFPARR
jgi:hypothetical protein